MRSQIYKKETHKFTSLKSGGEKTSSQAELTSWQMTSPWWHHSSKATPHKEAWTKGSHRVHHHLLSIFWWSHLFLDTVWRWICEVQYIQWICEKFSLACKVSQHQNWSEIVFRAHDSCGQMHLSQFLLSWKSPCFSITTLPLIVLQRHRWWTKHPTITWVKVMILLVKCHSTISENCTWVEGLEKWFKQHLSIQRYIFLFVISIAVLFSRCINIIVRLLNLNDHSPTTRETAQQRSDVCTRVRISHVVSL